MSSLDRFGVPTPSTTRTIMTMPKSKHKFRLQFFGFNNQLGGVGSKRLVQETDSVQLPKLSYTHHNMYRYHTEAGYVGRKSWGEINLTLRDSINNNLIKAILGQEAKMSNYSRRTIDAAIESRDYKFEMWIQVMIGSERVYDLISQIAGAVSDVSSIVSGFQSGGLSGALNADTTDYFQGTVCTWVLEGCIIKDFDFGDMDYSDSSFNTIELTIKPDNVYLMDETGNSIFDSSFNISNIQGAINTFF